MGYEITCRRNLGLEKTGVIAFLTKDNRSYSNNASFCVKIARTTIVLYWKTGVLIFDHNYFYNSNFPLFLWYGTLSLDLRVLFAAICSVQSDDLSSVILPVIEGTPPCVLHLRKLPIRIQAHVFNTLVVDILATTGRYVYLVCSANRNRVLCEM